LCLDDEPAVLNATVTLLDKWGCQVVGAANEAEAQRAFDDAGPDLMVLDFQLDHDVTGPEVYDRLCHMWGRRPPGLLVTAERSGAAQAAATKAGLELIRKPAAPAVLRAALSSLRQGLEEG